MGYTASLAPGLLDTVVRYGAHTLLWSLRSEQERVRVLTIGKVAGLAGVGVETMRFYQRAGLIIEPRKTRGSYRRYPPETVSRLRFIRRAKGLGFTLKEIQELLSLRITGGASREDVRRHAEEKIAELDEKMEAIQGMKDALQQLTRLCRTGKGGESDCPIFGALDKEGSDA